MNEPHEHTRALPAPEDDPRDREPNDNEQPEVPGPYNPVSVGPTSSEGFGNTHVMFPEGSVVPSAWSGWPVGWQVPAWNGDAASAWSSRLDVVFACVDLNSSILSTMPPYVLNNGQPVPEASFPWLTNPQPEVYSGGFSEFLKTALWPFLTIGDTFIYATARYANGYPSRFMVLNPTTVQVDLINGVREYRVNGVPVDPRDVLHVRYLSVPGKAYGVGPLEAGGARLLTVAALTRYATNLATTGGLPPAVLKYPRRVSRTQMRQMQADWIEARASTMGVPAVLADGTELDVLNPQLQDTALSELSKFSEGRIAVLLGVPPFLVGLPTADASTYVNSANVFDFHWRASLRPKAYAFCAALSEWLLPRGWSVELDRDEYTRPGFVERASGFATLIASGVLTPGQVAALERYGRSPEFVAATDDVAPPPATSPPDTPGQPGRPVITNTNGQPEEVV